MFGSIGMPELIIVLVIFIVFFGASKLPQAGQALGLGIKNFKKGMSGEEDDAVDVTPKKKKDKALGSGESDTEVEGEKADAAIRPK